MSNSGAKRQSFFTKSAGISGHGYVNRRGVALGFHQQSELKGFF